MRNEAAYLICVRCNHEMGCAFYLGRDGLDYEFTEKRVSAFHRRMAGLTPQDENRDVN
jgi:hypothetical protein